MLSRSLPAHVIVVDPVVGPQKVSALDHRVARQRARRAHPLHAAPKVSLQLQGGLSVAAVGRTVRGSCRR